MLNSLLLGLVFASHINIGEYSGCTQVKLVWEETKWSKVENSFQIATCSWAISPSLSLSWDWRFSMMLEPPDSLAASYTLFPVIDTDMVDRDWSKESSCRCVIRNKGEVMLHHFTYVMHKFVFISRCWNFNSRVFTWERMKVWRQALSVPLMELERDREGVDEAGGSEAEWVMVFLSWGEQIWNKWTYMCLTLFLS